MQKIKIIKAMASHNLKQLLGAEAVGPLGGVIWPQELSGGGGSVCLNLSPFGFIYNAAASRSPSLRHLATAAAGHICGIPSPIINPIKEPGISPTDSGHSMIDRKPHFDIFDFPFVSVIETSFVHSVRHEYGSNVARLDLSFLITSAGMFLARKAFLPPSIVWYNGDLELAVLFTALSFFMINFIINGTAAPVVPSKTCQFSPHFSSPSAATTSSAAATTSIGMARCPHRSTRGSAPAPASSLSHRHCRVKKRLTIKLIGPLRILSTPWSSSGASSVTASPP